MLLSCSLIIKINGSHDTTLLLSLMQPLLESHLNFSHVSLPPRKRKKPVLWRFLDTFISRQTNTVVSETRQHLMYLLCFLKDKDFLFSVLNFYLQFLQFFWNQQKFRAGIQCVCGKLCLCRTWLSGLSIINGVALLSCILWRTNYKAQVEQENTNWKPEALQADYTAIVKTQIPLALPLNLKHRCLEFLWLRCSVTPFHNKGCVSTSEKVCWSSLPCEIN